MLLRGINMFDRITYISDDQWERLRWVVNQKNPGFFENVIPPEAEVLERELIVTNIDEVSVFRAFFTQLMFDAEHLQIMRKTPDVLFRLQRVVME